MGIADQGPQPVRAETAAEADDSAAALNRDTLDALMTLVKRAGDAGRSIAAGFGVAPHDVLAMFKIDGGLPMKELAQRMDCDASFITVIADHLEKLGFLIREPCQRDRRVKNLVLTEEGTAARERMAARLAALMPWCYALTEQEQRSFLSMLQKMNSACCPATSQDDNGSGA